MHMHLPIANMVIDPVLIAAIGAGTGVVSGLFGVGGGFLLTPLLILNGIPASIAVSTQANQVLSTSLAGAAAHWRYGTLDRQLGGFMAFGGLLGSLIGVWLFRLLRASGNIEQVIAFGYIILLGSIGTLMLRESIGSVIHGDKIGTPRHRAGLRVWGYVLPFRRRFPVSGLHISVIPLILLGFAIGVIAAVMGIGGGFILAPAMVYLLGVPTRVMVGTSLYYIMFITALVTFLHAVVNQTVDLILAVVLMTGGVIGAPLGAALGKKLGSAQLRLLLALAILAVGGKLVIERFHTPETSYYLETGL